MKGKITILSLVLVSMLAAAIVASSAVAERASQSVTGSGQFEFTSDTGVTAFRTFAVEASKTADGSVSGQAQIDNRALGQRLHIRIDCLNVIGNVAVVSGIAWSATGPGNTSGDGAIFAVEDNGQGANAAPDRVTYAYTGTGLVCTDVQSAADVDPALFYDVEGGNIQIH